MSRNLRRTRRALVARIMKRRELDVAWEAPGQWRATMRGAQAYGATREEAALQAIAYATRRDSRRQKA